VGLILDFGLFSLFLFFLFYFMCLFSESEEAVEARFLFPPNFFFGLLSLTRNLQLSVLERYAFISTSFPYLSKSKGKR